MLTSPNISSADAQLRIYVMALQDPLKLFWRGTAKNTYLAQLHDTERKLWDQCAAAYHPGGMLVKDFVERTRHDAPAHATMDTAMPGLNGEVLLGDHALHRFANMPTFGKDVSMSDDFMARARKDDGAPCEISVPSCVDGMNETLFHAHADLLFSILRMSLFLQYDSLDDQGRKKVGESKAKYQKYLKDKDVTLADLLEFAVQYLPNTRIPDCYVGSSEALAKSATVRVVVNTTAADVDTYFWTHCLVQPTETMSIANLVPVGLCQAPANVWRQCPTLMRAAAEAKVCTFDDMESPAGGWVWALFTHLHEWVDEQLQQYPSCDLSRAFEGLVFLHELRTSWRSYVKDGLPQRLACLMRDVLDATFPDDSDYAVRDLRVRIATALRVPLDSVPPYPTRT